jgi:hypothetical protein
MAVRTKLVGVLRRLIKAQRAAQAFEKVNRKNTRALTTLDRAQRITAASN